MKNIRFTLSLMALAALTTAHAGINVYFGDATGTPINHITAPAVGSNFTLSVWYSSDVEVIDGEAFLGFDRTSVAGTGATPLDGKIGLASTPAASLTAGPNMVLTNPQLAGAGYGDPDGERPYGLSIAGVINSSFDLKPTTGVKLFDVQFKNLGLSTGSSTLSFFTSPTALLYRTYFIDGDLNEVTPTVGSLTVQAVPEPASIAALGLGALVAIRRRRRA